MSAELNCVQGRLELVNLINGKTIFKAMDTSLINTKQRTQHHEQWWDAFNQDTITHSKKKKKETTLNIEELVYFLAAGGRRTVLGNLASFEFLQSDASFECGLLDSCDIPLSV